MVERASQLDSRLVATIEKPGEPASWYRPQLIWPRRESLLEVALA